MENPIYAPRTAIWDGSGPSFTRLSPGYIPEDSHPESDNLNGFSPLFQAAYLLRLTNQPEWCIIPLAFPVEVPVLGQFSFFLERFQEKRERMPLPQSSQAPALQAQSPRTARGQIRIMGYHDRSEPV